MAAAENSLRSEKSPYLLQHADNPVDWHAWNDEAFEKAKAEDKPVLLSIGYSTCHWCHVMAHESFEDTATAKLMNENFISIKVDREERPDIDHLYMQYVMATTGGGGWPMTVFLTPDKKPFYGGTYFPPEDRYGRPGFKTLLKSLSGAWKERRNEILESAESARQFLNQKKESVPGSELTEASLHEAFHQFQTNHDSQFGGFGRVPKFPMGHAVSFVLRAWKRFGEARGLEMAVHTLRNMAQGGLYDHLGGGFHRYSTDRQWRVPHFEKMLYDQALLVPAYLEAYQATREGAFARVARETLEYVLREMTDKNGGFFSAQDADSPDPANPSISREGAYYVWTRAEIENILGKEDAALFIRHFGIEEKGNALEDPQGEFKNQNVLYEADAGAGTKEAITKSKQLLFAERLKRPKPHLDDKVLTDWNGLMIAAFSSASRVLNEPRYAAAAENAADFILKNLSTPDGRLLHRYRDGEAGIEAGLDDYAFMIYGLIGLYEATFESRWLTQARRLFQTMHGEFWDPEEKGFFLSSQKTKDLIARPKTAYDGALPSGNSVAALDALKLSRLTGETSYEDTAREIFQAFANEVSAQPTGFAQMLTALDFAVGPSTEIVLASHAPDSVFQAMTKEIYLRFLPNKTTLWVTGDGDRPVVDGKTTAYICKNKVCGLPLTELESFRKSLE